MKENINPVPDPCEPQQQTLVLHKAAGQQQESDMQEIEKLGSFVKSATTKMNVEPATAVQVRLAVEEAVVNAMSYAYPAGTDGEVIIQITTDGHCLKTIVSDSGVPFDPTGKAPADTLLPAEERQIGGLGILLFSELMDKVSYERCEGKNILVLEKNLIA